MKNSCLQVMYVLAPKSASRSFHHTLLLSKKHWHGSGYLWWICTLWIVTFFIFVQTLSPFSLQIANVGFFKSAIFISEFWCIAWLFVAHFFSHLTIEFVLSPVSQRQISWLINAIVLCPLEVCTPMPFEKKTT